MALFLQSSPTPAASQSAQAEPAEDHDESCKLSMSEKLALFNKLALPEKQSGGPAAGPPERRRQKGARYHTQPITVEEVSLVRRHTATVGSSVAPHGSASSTSPCVQLQKGPVQLPAFSLPPQLADRQLDSSVNLKPSEVRLSQQRSDPPGEPGEPTQHRDSEAALRGILKKSREGSGPDGGGQRDAASCQGQNGGGWERVLPVPPRRQRRPAPGGEGGSPSAAPWRQRARNRRETIACPPGRTWEEQGPPQDRRDKPLEQLDPPVEQERAAQ